MKKVILIGGPYGAGKTTVANLLTNSFQNTVMLDGEWCWYQGNNWIFNNSTKDMAIDNICYVLSNFLKNDNFENIIFTWVLHKAKDHKTIINALRETGIEFELYDISLICSEFTLLSRLKNRIQSKATEFDAYYNSKDIFNTLEGSLKKLNQINQLDTYKIDVSDLTKNQVKEKIIEYVGLGSKQEKIFIKH